MFKEFPTVEHDELVTKAFLRAELAEALNAQTQRLMTAVVASMTALTAIFSAIVLFAR